MEATMESGIALLQRYHDTRNAEAFAVLAQRYGGMVYSAALRITGNRHDAEDVAQECFVELARKAGTIRSSVSGWLHSLAVSRAKNLCRESTRRRKREATAMGTHDSPSWAEIAPQIDEAIQDLPDDHRTAIVARFLEGRSQSDLAEEWGVNQSNVSRRINKALESLRVALHRRGIPVVAGALLLSLLDNAAEAVPATLTAGLGKIAVSGIGASSKVAGAVFSAKTLLGASIVACVAAAAVAVVIHHEAAGGRRPELNPPSALPTPAAGGGESSPTLIAPVEAGPAPPALQESAVERQLDLVPSPALVPRTEEQIGVNPEPLAAAAGGELADVKTLRALLSQAIARFVEQEYAHLPENARREMLAEADIYLTPGTHTIAMEGGHRTVYSGTRYPELRVPRAQLPTADDIVRKMREDPPYQQSTLPRIVSNVPREIEERFPNEVRESQERLRNEMLLGYARTEAGNVVVTASSSLQRLCAEKRGTQ